MRYLGQVAELVKEGAEHYHLRFMLERDVVTRCLKHLICKYVRECQSDELVGPTVSHILNCIFAPRDFIKRMDEKEIAYNGTTIQGFADLNLLENMQKLHGPNSAAEAAKTEVESQPISKRQKKKQRLAAKNAGPDQGETESKVTKASQIYEILFPKDNVEEFEVSELFMEPAISLNVAESPASAALSLTPRQLYLEIKHLAEKRYGYALLPKKQH